MTSINRPGVIASAIVAIAGSVASLLMGLLMVLGGIAVAASPDPTSAQARFVLARLVVPMIVCFGFGAWGLTSAIGLLLRRNWARLCFVIFGALLAICSFVTSAGSLLVAFVVPASASSLPDNVSEGLFRGLFAGISAVSVVCLGIAIWWLVYFNRSAVKASLGGEVAEPAPASRFPLAVAIVAWFLIAVGAIAALEMLGPQPVFLFGIAVRGLAASLLLALFAAVGFSAGIGMLKKRVEAHSLAVGFFGFGILNGMSLILLPGSFARLQDAIRETPGGQALPPGNMNAIMMVAALIGLLTSGTLLVMLIKARTAYVDACRLHVE